MRIHLLVKRNALPDTAIVWAVDELANPPISALLDQINEVIPLESGAEWGLEDYSVELRTSKGSYELLHWQNVNALLKDDDEVLVRPLTSREIKQRGDAGRSQITQDGKRIVDGIPFGGTKRKIIANRPPVVIPSRKRARLTYDEEDEEEKAAPALRLTQFPHNGGSDAVGWKREKKARFAEPELEEDQDDEDEDSEEDKDFEPPGDDDDEDDRDLSVLDDELKGLLEEAGSSDKENTAAKLSQETTGTPSNKENVPAKSTKQNVAPSTINKLMIGTVQPIIKGVVQEFQEAFPQLPGTVLEKMLINPPIDSKLVTVYDALNVGSEAKKSKTSIMNAIWKLLDSEAEAEHEEEAAQSARQPKRAATIARLSKGENKENIEAPDVAGDEDDDEDDGSDEDFPEEAAKADNGWLPGHIDASGRLLGAGLEKMHVRFEDSGDDELPADGMIDISDDSSSSSESDSDSDDEPVIVSSKKAAAHVLDSDTSSSGTSSSGSDSESESDNESESDSDPSSSSSDSSSESDSDSDSEPEQQSSKVQPKPVPLSAQTAPPPSAINASNSASTTTPPGEGLSRTKARNERRRKQNVLQRLQKKRILPAGTTLTEFMKLDTVDDNTSPEAAAEAVAAIRKENGGEERAEKKKQTKEAKQAALEAERQRMIAQLYSGGIDVNPTAPEPKLTEEAAEPVKSRKERKANTVANRLIFTGLGQKVPKNMEEADAISKKLMKGVRPVVDKPTEPEAAAASEDIIDDPWRENIKIYRAVESKHRGEVFNEPPFPFVQKSYIPETSALHPSNFRKGKKGKNKRRVQEEEQHEEQQYEGEPYYQKEETPSHKKHKRMHGDEDNFDNNVDNTVLNYDEGDEDLNGQLMQEAQEQEEVEDLIALPEDPMELPAVKPEEMKTGMVVAFKELTISEETGWQPVISDWRTAVVIGVDEPLKAVTIVLAVRDREVRSYDEETGERIHGKFDMPVDDDEYEVEDDGVRTKEFGEFMEPQLVQAPEETMESEAAENPQDAEDAEGDTATDAEPDKDEVTTEPANAAGNNSPTLEQTEDQEMMDSFQDEAAADQDRNQSPQDKGRQLQNAATTAGTLTAHVAVEATTITTVETSEVAAVSTDSAANELVEQLQQAMDGEMEALGAPAEEAQHAPQTDESTNPLRPPPDFSPKFHGLGSMADNTDKSQPFIVSRSSQMPGAVDGDHSTENSAPKSFFLEESQIAKLNERLSTAEATAASAPISIADTDGANDTFTFQGDEEPDEPPRSSQWWTQDIRPTKESNAASRPGSAVGSQSVEAAKRNPFRASRPSSVAQKSLSDEGPSRPASAFSEFPIPSQLSYSQPSWQSAQTAPSRTVSQRSGLENKENESRPSSLRSQGHEHTRSLPPPAKEFMSLKDRLKAASLKNKVRISAKKPSKRTKSVEAADESYRDDEEVNSAPAAAQAQQENDEFTVQKPDSEDEGPCISQRQKANAMFISEDEEPQPRRAIRATRSKKDRQSMPNLGRNQNQSSPFQPPMGSQIFDLTVTDDEDDATDAMENDPDLQGEAVRIPTADDGMPGGFARRQGLEKMKNNRERRKLKQAKSNEWTGNGMITRHRPSV